VYWSYEADPYSPRRRAIVDRIEGYVDVARNIFSRTRWFRTGVMIR
jgi:hypothetical protein